MSEIEPTEPQRGIAIYIPAEQDERLPILLGMPKPDRDAPNWHSPVFAIAQNAGCHAIAFPGGAAAHADAISSLVEDNGLLFYLELTENNILPTSSFSLYDNDKRTLLGCQQVEHILFSHLKENGFSPAKAVSERGSEYTDVSVVSSCCSIPSLRLDLATASFDIACRNIADCLARISEEILG